MTDETHTVTCVKCKTQFDGFGPEQANGCASDVHDSFIVGYYALPLLT